MTPDERRWTTFSEKLNALVNAEDNSSGILEAVLGFAVGRLLVEGHASEDIQEMFETCLQTLQASRVTFVPGGDA